MEQITPEIFEVAHQLFAKNGFRSVSLKDIENKAHVRLHPDWTKEYLVAQILEHLIQHTSTILRSEAQKELHTAQKLFNSYLTILQYLSGFSLIFFNELSRYQPENNHTLQTYFDDEHFVEIAQILERGKQKGEIKSYLNVDVEIHIHKTLLALLFSEWQSGSGTIDVKLFKQLFRFRFEGISTEHFTIHDIA